MNYTYGNSNWGDLLTSYDGVSISYDAIGNPLNDGTWTYTWEHGRQLASMSNGSTTWSYTYDANGMRTSRTDGTTAYSYVYNGSQLVQMVYAYNSTATTFNFYYDASGAPLSVNSNGTDYYYVTNLQGDIVAILNASGAKVASYEYDAWGKITDFEIVPVSTFDAYLAFNPLRYRGYVYDTESELYYLQSRYYDPEVGRFLNADALVATGQGLTGNNMYTYCGNNPVGCTDHTGAFWEWVAIGVGIFVAAVTLTGCSASHHDSLDEYVYSDSTEYNCYAYVLGEKEWRYVGGSKDAVTNYDIENIASLVENDVRNSGRGIRRIDSYDSPISQNEYRIALRTGEKDYHFMVQHSDGTWSHKPGDQPTQLIAGNNPSEVSWDLPVTITYSGQQYLFYISNYYNSEVIIYFAVTK